MPFFKTLISTSRPRFWLYTLGPYLVGLVATADGWQQLISWPVLLFGFYYLFPANLLIYGINDLFDKDTDLENAKKAGYETRLEDSNKSVVLIWALLLNLPFLAASLLIPGTLVPLCIFLFLALFYSAPPVRAKAIPFLDSAFNFLYVLPGVLAFQMLSGEFPDAVTMIAAGLWTASMHAYSAVPDIEADRSAGLSTIATVLGARPTLVLCGVLFVTAAAFSYRYLSFLAVFLGLAYAASITLSLLRQDGDVFPVYRRFPLVNSIAGFLIFWFLVLERFDF